MSDGLTAVMLLVEGHLLFDWKVRQKGHMECYEYHLPARDSPSSQMEVTQ